MALVHRPEFEPGLGLFPFMITKDFNSKGRQSNLAPTAVRLRRFESQSVLGLLQGLVDGNAPAFKVDVFPPKSQKFPTAKAGSDRDDNRNVKPGTIEAF